ncbi:YbhB/YbcL family Raf kinase inhibitor-like protein [Altererythrobacter sp.]|nr:YbhB/YbcL family Raf kinase inhibitor-like protein [Altererythrobacter sp.]
MADWLSSALPAGTPAHPGLALASLAEQKVLGRGGLTLTSPAFAAGDELDPCFTADEEDAVAPPLEWSAPPPGTQELAIVVEDASSDGPTTHWMVWGLAPQRGKLLEGEVPPRVGKNSGGNSEWLLPALPKDGPPHTFVFQLFALDLPMTLMPGAKREQLFKEMEGHVMAAAVLTATYQASEKEDWVDEDEGDFA